MYSNSMTFGIVQSLASSPQFDVSCSTKQRSLNFALQHCALVVHTEVHGADQLLSCAQRSSLLLKLRFRLKISHCCFLCNLITFGQVCSASISWTCGLSDWLPPYPVCRDIMRKHGAFLIVRVHTKILMSGWHGSVEVLYFSTSVVYLKKLHGSILQS